MPVIPPRQKRSQRPETDSKRWLPQEAQHPAPGNRPLYDLRVQRIDGYKKAEKNHNRLWYGQDGSWRHMHKVPPAYGYIVQLHNPSASVAPAGPSLSFLSTVYSVLCFIFLAAIFISAAKAPPKRRGRGRL